MCRACSIRNASKTWAAGAFGLDLTRFCGAPEAVVGGVRNWQNTPRLPIGVPAAEVGLVRAGRDPEELTCEFEPSAQVIRIWVRQAEHDGDQRADGLTRGEREDLARLRRENRQLHQEHDILAKAAACFAREAGTIPSGSAGL